MDKKNNFIDDLSKESLESFQDEVLIKQKKNYIPTIIFCSTVLIIVFVLLLTFTKGTIVPNMIGWNEKAVSNWSNKTNAIVTIESRYSTDVESGEVIEQELAAGSELKRNNTITIYFSKGANPLEKINFPDVKNMNLTEVNKWINDNKLSSITIVKENSTAFAENDVINFKIIDGSQTDFIRKNRVKIYVSMGSKELSDTITVIDFIEKSKADVVKWANEYNTKITFVEEFNEYVDNGLVSDQSIEKQTKISRTDKVVVTLSLGKAIRVPNFIGMSRNEVNETSQAASIKVNFKQETSDQKENTVIKQDVVAGSTIHDKQFVTMTIAVKSEFITVPNFIGLSLNEASTLASLYNIRTFFIQKESTEICDQVIQQDAEQGKEINLNSIVNIYVSNGSLLIPDLSIMNRTEAELWANKNSITIDFIERYSNDIDVGNLYGQSQTSPYLQKGDKLFIYCSLGKVGVKDFTSSTKLDVINWQRECNKKGADISLEFHKVHAIGIEANTVTDQSIKGDLVDINSKIDLWIADDNHVLIPNMTSVDDKTFVEWCKSNSIEYAIEDRYSNEYVAGVLYGQNYIEEAIPSGGKLTIYRSLGKVYVISLRGYTKAEIEGWVNSLNLFNADIKVKYVIKSSDSVQKGSVITNSQTYKRVAVGSTIEVLISSGAN